MSLEKAKNRDKKRQKRNKMRVSGKSVFLIQEIQIKKSDKIKKEKETDSCRKPIRKLVLDKQK